MIRILRLPLNWGRLAVLAPLTVTMACGGSTAAVQEPSPQQPVQVESPTEPAPPPAMPATTRTVEVQAGEFDNGKMWTFEYPPLAYFGEEYGFSPDSAWFAKARLSALRIQGCSASFVSPSGLVLTNHHCARESVSEVSRPGEHLLDNGFYAGSVDDERQAAGQVADQLIAIVDVTAEIHDSLATAATDAERADILERAEEAARTRVADQYGEEDFETVVEIISLWDGAKYSAYVFRRYTDVRLVLAPELKIGFFGGDPDNFTYPRYNLDMSFYRIYGPDGEPLQSDYYFDWSEDGVEEGDAVFVIGNPGGSSRLQTVAQLEWRSAVLDKAIYKLLESRADILQAFADRNPEKAEEMDLVNQIFSLRNSEKAYRGMWEGLQNPEYIARRKDTERQFRKAIDKDPELSAKYGGLLDRMAAIQAARMEFADEFGAFIALGSPAFTSAILQRAFSAYQYTDAKSSGAPEQMLSQIKDRLLSVENQDPSLQRALLTARLRDFETHLGSDSEIGKTILQGRTPEEAADAILAHSALTDSARTLEAVEADLLTLEDPALQVVSAIIEPIRNYQRAFQQLAQEEATVTAELGRARFDVYGTTIPPDATFSLRIADGVVTGYPYNGTYAPIYTTFYGLYDHYYSYGSDSEWDLPERWLNPPASFDMSKPLNFVLTADVIGGNSGSPVINTDLEVVGLIFDGNIESLPGDYIYDPAVNRSVAVDVRGILEALDEIYDADRIVLELTTGRMVETEAEADGVLGR